MSHALFDREVIDVRPNEYLQSIGTVFAEFDKLTQDSGNISYGVDIAGNWYFVKTAGRPEQTRAVLKHPARLALLRNAVRLRERCHHFTLPTLHRVIESPFGPMLIYEWLDGELLGASRAQRDDPATAFQRFRGLPAPTIRRCLTNTYELHEEIARAGWLAVDFYDGCLIYNFAAGRLAVVDVDMHH